MLLRLVLATVVIYLPKITFLQAPGGLLLPWMARTPVNDGPEEGDDEVQKPEAYLGGDRACSPSSAPRAVTYRYS
jgi:hypothetical protein